ncbi:MAG: FkbM family methyltransferase [Cytophagaceae bacterium]|nr:FkbM family methyltransferase [Cytophagaceae bacterium]
MRKSSSYFTELSWLLFVKRLGKLLPKRLRFRFYKLFYNYESARYIGVRLIIPYFESLNLQFIVFTKYLIDWNVFFFGQYEKETNDLLFEYIKPGQVILEAGANNGTETVLLSRLVGPNGKVLAFEPVEHIYQTLQLNLSINHCTNVQTEQKALGESDGQLHFNVLSEDFCNQGMASKYDETSADAKVLVQQTSIDSWVVKNNIRTVDFIKMDIQGAEIELLKGAKHTIEKSKPLIFTEATEDFLSIEKLFDALTDLGYAVYFISSKGQLRLLSKSSLVEGNWLAKPLQSI